MKNGTQHELCKKPNKKQIFLPSRVSKQSYVSGLDSAQLGMRIKKTPSPCNTQGLTMRLGWESGDDSINI